jgi:hypothetical protein
VVLHTNVCILVLPALNRLGQWSVGESKKDTSLLHPEPTLRVEPLPGFS